MTGDDPLDCDFEKDLCSWTQGRGDDFDLARYQGNTLTAMTGPSSDHTIGGSKKTNHQKCRFRHIIFFSIYLSR